MTLTVPRAGVVAGRSANIQIEEPQTGSMVADLGRSMLRVGSALKAEAESRELGTIKNRMMEDLNDLRLEYEQIGDPDRLEAELQPRLDALRQSYTSGLKSADPRFAEMVGQTFDQMKEPHRFALGARALDLRQGQWRVNLGNMGDQIVRSAATFDPDTQAEYIGQYEEELAEAVAQGILTPEEADRQLKSRVAEADKARAERLLRDDPAALLDWIDGDGLASLDADARERWKTRAASTIETQAATAEAEDRARLRSDIARAINARREGRVADIEADLLANPIAQQDPAFEELALRIVLDDEDPIFRRLPPAEMRARRAEEAARPVQSDAQLLIQRAMDQAIEEAEKAWADDPQAQYARVTDNPLPDLPDLATASGEDLAAILRARAVRARAMTELGYTDTAALFTRDEREALGETLGTSGNPAVRAKAAAAFAVALNARGLGVDPMAAAAELGLDGVFTHVGGLLAYGGASERMARQVFEGQRIIDARDTPLPPLSQQRGEAFRALTEVLTFGIDPERGTEDERALYDQITGSAIALYAQRAANDADFKDGRLRETDFLQAVHEVMGGTGKYDSRTATGGIRRVGGVMTIVPQGTRARDIEAGLQAVGIDLLRDPRAMAVEADFGNLPQLGAAAQFLEDDRAVPKATEDTMRAIAANGNLPMFGGQPMDPATWSRGRLRALADGTYTLEFVVPGSGELRMAADENGDPWEIDIRALVDLGRQP